MKSIAYFFAGLLLLGLSACTSQTSTATVAADSLMADSAVADMDPTVDDEGLDTPPAKSQADLDALEKHWNEAVAKEQNFLGNDALAKMVGKLTETTDEDGMPVIGKLTDKQFKALKPRELVYYANFHPEEWEQICAEFLFNAGEVKGICTHLPFDADFLSERQMAALTANDSTKPLIVKCIQSTRDISRPMMHLVVNQKVHEAIGPMVDAYKSQSIKDDLILSAFIEMMVNAEYQDWIGSDLYLEMTGKSREWMPLTQENVDTIIAIAQKFAASAK